MLFLKKLDNKCLVFLTFSLAPCYSFPFPYIHYASINKKKQKTEKKNEI